VSNKLGEIFLETPSEPDGGLKGFCCPDNVNRTFDYCTKECNKRSECPPFPLLLSLMQDRTVVPNVYSVTEILNPPQVVYYSRNFPHYTTPEDRIWMTFGSAWHAITLTEKNVKELGLEDEYLIEKSFERDFIIDGVPVKLKGRSDLYVTSTKALWDFKTLKYYFVQKIWETKDWSSNAYQMQMNIYRAYQYPEAEKIKIYALVKDHSRYIEKRYGIHAVETLDVPIMPDNEIKDMVTELLHIHVRNQADPSGLRKCTDKELWKNKKGEPIRCIGYCPIRDFCPQWKEYNESINTKKHKTS